MTGAEFKAARETLGLSYGELSAILGGVRPDTIRRKWEIDKPSPSPMACQIVRWMLDGYRPPEWPKDMDRDAYGARGFTRSGLVSSLEKARLDCSSSEHWLAIRFCEILLTRIYPESHRIIQAKVQ